MLTRVLAWMSTPRPLRRPTLLPPPALRAGCESCGGGGLVNVAALGRRLLAGRARRKGAELPPGQAEVSGSQPHTHIAKRIRGSSLGKTPNGSRQVRAQSSQTNVTLAPCMRMRGIVFDTSLLAETPHRLGPPQVAHEFAYPSPLLCRAQFRSSRIRTRFLSEQQRVPVLFAQGCCSMPCLC